MPKTTTGPSIDVTCTQYVLRLIWQQLCTQRYKVGATAPAYVQEMCPKNKRKETTKNVCDTFQMLKAKCSFSFFFYIFSSIFNSGDTYSCHQSCMRTILMNEARMVFTTSRGFSVFASQLKPPISIVGAIEPYIHARSGTLRTRKNSMGPARFRNLWSPLDLESERRPGCPRRSSSKTISV